MVISVCCHCTWHAVHSSHHRGPDGGNLSWGFSSFTVTFAGPAVPRLRHSHLKLTHKQYLINANPQKPTTNTKIEIMLKNAAGSGKDKEVLASCSEKQDSNQCFFTGNHLTLTHY